jgi:hypothetical protein
MSDVDGIRWETRLPVLVIVLMACIQPIASHVPTSSGEVTLAKCRKDMSSA